MSVHVCFISSRGIGSVDSPAIGNCRRREAIALSSVTTGSSVQNEIILIQNEESSTVLVAWGSAPDAALTTYTGASSAGVPVGAGQSIIICPAVGDKVSAKAVS